MKLRNVKPEETSMFFALHRAKPDEIEKLYSDISKNEHAWVLNAINNHLEARGINFEKSVKIAVLYICDNTVGYCVHYIERCLEWMDKHNFRKPLDLKTFKKIFKGKLIEL